jgi:hypothetical protein
MITMGRPKPASLWASLLLAWIASAGWAQAPTPPAAPAAKLGDIVRGLEATEALKHEALVGYQDRQIEVLRSDSHAEATVSGVLDYSAPGHMTFTPTLEEGSTLLRHRVLMPIIQEELRSVQPENREKSALSRDNYNFELLADQSHGSCGCYILRIDPLRKQSTLIKGKAWIDARDFGIHRIEGDLAKNPSFWLTSVHIVRNYSRIGDFWLPSYTHSESHVRLFGAFFVDMRQHYWDLRVNRAPLLLARTTPPGIAQPARVADPRLQNAAPDRARPAETRTTLPGRPRRIAARAGAGRTEVVRRRARRKRRLSHRPHRYGLSSGPANRDTNGRRLSRRKRAISPHHPRKRRRLPASRPTKRQNSKKPTESASNPENVSTRQRK